MDSQTAAESLRKMAVTAGCRFIAAERLQARNKHNALLIAVASSIVIVLTIIPFIYRASPLVSADLTTLTIFVSMLILAFSIIQYGANDAANAEQLHRSGLEINEVRRNLEIDKDIISAADLNEVISNYNSVLQKYSINHATLDFDIYRIRHPWAYKLNLLDRIAIYVRLFVSTKTPFLWMIIILIAFTLIFLSDVAPARHMLMIKEYADTKELAKFTLTPPPDAVFKLPPAKEPNTQAKRDGTEGAPATNPN